MFGGCRYVAKSLTIAFAVMALALAEPLLYVADAASGGRGGGRGHGGMRAGGMAGRGHVGAARGHAVHSGSGRGFHGGSGHRLGGGFARPRGFHSFRNPSVGHQKFHHRSKVFINAPSFVYPFYSPYSYYPPYPYYPSYSSYPAYPETYDPGYAAAPYGDPYPDPGWSYTQRPADTVQVYTAPLEPAPIPQPQPPTGTPDRPVPREPLEDGSLRFEVSPEETRVFLDERYLGEARDLADTQEMAISAGQHLLEFRLGRERTFMQAVVSPRKVTTIRLALDLPTTSPAALRAETGLLRLQVAPIGSAIYLDGALAVVARGSDPVSLPLAPGQHSVQIVMPGHREYGTVVTVPERGEAVLAVRLTRE